MRSTFGSLTIVALVLLGVTATRPALADSLPAEQRAQASAEPISVKVNMARILRISAPAATVVIGNPGVADVTIQDPQTLILTGKSFGETNMIVLDSKGQVVVDTSLRVVLAQANLVTVYNSGARATLACAPACEPTVMLGDDPVASQGLISSMSLVQGMAH
jgi:Flp pilus assembly secretin CpaC